jgi:hypothetical protein
METSDKERIGNAIISKLLDDVQQDLKNASKVLSFCYTEIRERVKHKKN